MEWFILWVGLAIVVGVAANKRRRSGIGWFLLALLISPLIAGLLVLALGSKTTPAAYAQPTAAMPVNPPPSVHDTKECPRCAETIKRAAKVCRFCGHEIEATNDNVIIPESYEYRGVKYRTLPDASIVSVVDGRERSWRSIHDFQNWVDLKKLG